MFVDLRSSPRHLAPIEITEPRLLTSAFLRPPADVAESTTVLQQWLGVARLTPAAFYIDHVFPRLGQLPVEVSVGKDILIFLNLHVVDASCFSV